MNTLVDTLTLSARLAERWAAVTPDAALAWNPRDLNSTLAAVETWLGYVDAHLFPVNTYCRDLRAATECLARVPVMPQGTSLLAEEYDGQYGLDDVFYLLLTVEYLAELDEWGDMEFVLQTLRDKWSFTRLVPLHKIGDWLDDELYRATRQSNQTLMAVWAAAEQEEPEAGGGEPGEFPQDAPFWQGLARLVRYYLQDTPHDILNWADDLERNAGYVENCNLDWLDAEAIGRLVDEMHEVEQYMAPARRVYDWTETSAEHLQRAIAVLQQACAGVAEMGWRPLAWERINWLLAFAGSATWDDQVAREYGM